MRICEFPDCGRPLLAKGLCNSHYSQRRKGEELRPIATSPRKNVNQPCSFEGCDLHATRKGLCPSHREQELRGEPLRPLRNRSEATRCTAEGCERRSKCRGYCDSHYAQLRRTGVIRPLHVAAHRYIDGHGYVRLLERDHPNAGKNGLVAEHIKVMAEVLGRPLIPGENVHHKNGVRDDNRPSNLELWTTSQPKGQRVADKVEWAIDLLRLYQPDILKE